MSKFKEFNRKMDRYLDRYDQYVYYRWHKLPKINQLMIWNGLGLMVMCGFIAHFVIGYVVFGLVIIQLRMYLEETKRHVVREL